MPDAVASSSRCRVRADPLTEPTTRRHPRHRPPLGAASRSRTGAPCSPTVARRKRVQDSPSAVQHPSHPGPRRARRARRRAGRRPPRARARAAASPAPGSRGPRRRSTAAGTSTSRRPSPTGTTAPTSDAPCCGRRRRRRRWPRRCRPRPGPSGGRAGCARWWRPRDAGRRPRSRAGRAGSGRPVHAPRRRAGHGPARCRGGAAGRGWPGRRRSGRGSGGCSAEKRASKPSGAGVTRRMPTSAGRMPRSRVAAASSTGRRGAPPQLPRPARVDVGVGDLTAGVHPGIRAACDDQAHRRRAAQDGRERVAEQRPRRCVGPAGRPSRRTPVPS